MKWIFFFPACLLLLAGCNPLILDVPKSEIIEMVPASSDYVTRTTGAGSELFVRIVNSEIRIDRDIDVYYKPYFVDGYWGLVTDVDIIVPPDEGELLIYDPAQGYLGTTTIRIIIRWFEEEEYQHEQG